MLSLTSAQQYLDHIGCSSDAHRSPSLAALRNINAAHLYSIPFANLTTVQNNRHVQSTGFVPSVPSVAPIDILQKLTVDRRGGYCFEHNGLLAAVLRALGYDIYQAAARVVKSSDEDTGMVTLNGYDHEVVLVRGPSDDAWRLVVVGFGGPTPTHPLLLEHPSSDDFSGDLFRMRRGLIGRCKPPSEQELSSRRHGAGWYMQRYSQSASKWEDQYFFTEAEAQQADFKVMNWAVATQPHSMFYKTLVMAILKPGGGRVTLVDEELRIHPGHGDSDVHVQKLETSEQFQSALKEHFGVEPVGAADYIT